MVCPGSRGKGLSVEAQIENAAAGVDASARRRSHSTGDVTKYSASGGLGCCCFVGFDQRAP